MDSEERTTHRQLIDDNKVFNRNAIDKAATTLSKCEKDYYSIAIIGVQNSGKSTLLNNVFGTNFDVLQEQSRTRTTRGILTSIDQSQNLIIYDVEGNDARDRSQEQDFEKMVATYALVIANTLIINIWCKSLGQHTGSQYQTLKVVMDICISQFKQQSPKTILYCVRDFKEGYDNEYQLRRKIIRDVNDIWRQLNKPQQMKIYDTKPQKFFTIDVVFLRRYYPNKPEQFLQDIAKLRQRFTNKDKDEYIFKHQKTQFNLPISDLPQLSQNTWQAIKENKKLNLPSQKIQLASFRCSTITAEIQAQFIAETVKIESSSEIFSLGEVKEKYLMKYEDQTYQYGKEVVEEKKKELQEAMDDILKKICHDKIEGKISQLVRMFSEKSKNASQEMTVSYDEFLKKLKNDSIENLIGSIKKLDYQVTNRKEKIDSLSSKLEQKLTEVKNTMLKLSKQEFENQSCRKIRVLASQSIKQYFQQQFWVKAYKIFFENSQQITEKYQKKYEWITGQSIHPLEYDQISQNLLQQFKQSIKTQFQNSLSNRVIEHFNNLFKNDEEGDKINFSLKSEEEIGEHFDVVRDKIILLIKKLNECEMTGKRHSFMDFEEEVSFFQSTWLSNTTEQIEKSMRNQFEKTMRRKKQGEMNRVPWWLFVIIGYFVYDDLWFSEHENPIIHHLLTFILVIVTFMFVIGQGQIVRQLLHLIIDKLKQWLPFLR